MYIRLFTALLTLCTLSLSAQIPALIPQPVSVKAMAGSFILQSATSISVSKPEARGVAEMLVQHLNRATGYNIRISNAGHIRFILNNTLDATIGQEGYTLEVNGKTVKITANTTTGLFYGMQTLLQLLPPEIERSSASQRTSWRIPAVMITDYPRFEWRGVMLDVSRHFFSKEDVKKYIDRMARYKYNVFHWHLTDDNGWRVEIKSRPLLTKIGGCRVQRYGKFGGHAAPKPDEPATDCGFYTQEDIKEIVAYAAMRHVSVLPEIDVPGHSMAAIAAYPELSCTKIKPGVSPGHTFADWHDDGTFTMLEDNTLNPSDEKVYAFLDDVFGEIATLFPFDYIHMGGDECYHGYWEKDPGCQALMEKQGLKKAMDLQDYFVGRVEKIVRSKGKKLIGWDEILEGELAPQTVVMSWRGMKGGVEAAHRGHKFVMSANDYLYIDLAQGEDLVEPDATRYKRVSLKKTYDFEPMPDGVDAKSMLGGQVSLWSEKIPTLRHAEYMTWPRTWAAADMFWSPKGTKNWNAFIERMEQHFERFDAAGVNYARSVYDPVVKMSMKDGKLMAEMTTEINGLDIYYSLDETTPDSFGMRYTQPIVIPEGNSVTLKAISYRNGKPVGKLLVLPAENLKKRVK
jgi:hexosaminidase